MAVPVIRVSGEGIFPHPHSMPHIGMSIERAAGFIREDWQSYLETNQRKAREKEQPKPEKTERNKLWREGVTLTGGTSLHALRETIRDCGWCVAHQGDHKALHRLYELALKGMDSNGDGYKLSRIIDHAFHGIAGWMA